MLLTISTTHSPATDLGYLLHKSPEKVHSLSFAHGEVHVLYPEASDARCTAALLVEIDPVGLVRREDEAPLAAYVSDRPYVTSSIFTVALARAFGTALSGRSKERQALADTAIALEARVSVVAARGGEALVRQLFEPLGWRVEVERVALDSAHPEWGPGRILRLSLTGTARVAELLAHLYVLLPVLDDEKHYWVDEGEVEKLLAHGEGWLEKHPLRELVARRYLKHRGALVKSALTRLEPIADDEDAEAESERAETELERPISLDARRRERVIEILREARCAHVADAGCGEGKLTIALAKESFVERVIGLDVHARSLSHARERMERLPEHVRRKIEILTGSIVYRDSRLAELDAIVCVEVIEHIDLPRLDSVEHSLFAAARPRVVVFTTPNRDHNALFPSLPAGAMRHADHRFEWSREELARWAAAAAERYGYALRIEGIGDSHPELGAPTQAAVFTRIDGARGAS